MLRSQTHISSQTSQPATQEASSRGEVNAMTGADQFITPEPTPTMESRRGWRRRRIARGKS